jgi:hypothetical protein
VYELGQFLQKRAFVFARGVRVRHSEGG